MGTKLIRKFDKQRYQYLYFKLSKSEAQKAAENERKAGWKIRIIKTVTNGRSFWSLYGSHTGKRPQK